MHYYQSPNFNSSTKRFENTNGQRNERKILEVLKVTAKYFGRNYDEWEKKGFPRIYSSKEELTNFSENVMWVGHSTVMINHKGKTILTDPHFSERAGPFGVMGPKRITPPPFNIEDLPKIDIILISHNHFDHLDKQSIVNLVKRQPNVKFFVPLGLSKILGSFGAKNIIEIDWWQSVDYEGIDIQATQVQHWSRRSLFDRNKTLWSGWMLRWNDFSFYFAGDSGYSNDFLRTAERCGNPTLAAIPIGSYEPKEFMKAAHMSPDDAVRAFQDIGAKYAIGIHWGTFKLTLEKLDEPPRLLEKALENAKVSKNRFKVLQHGEFWPEVFY